MKKEQLEHAILEWTCTIILSASEIQVVFDVQYLLFGLMREYKLILEYNFSNRIYQMEYRLIV